MWTSDKVEELFLDYFDKNNYTKVKESSVIPSDNDKSLLFVNSGMVQFKDIFLGKKKYDNKKICNSQKCIRVGGKHNDLDEVGFDSYHHTLFKMLGCWNFNCDEDSKKEIIGQAHDLLVNYYKLNPDNIYITYYSSDDGINIDNETKECWEKYFNSEKILPFGEKDNFWKMADYGPCGYCTEIHYDKIGNRDASMLVNKNDPNVIEIWNIVFISFNNENGELKKLDKHFIDTGAGLERLVSVLNNCTNYQTDKFHKIINTITEEYNCPIYTDTYNTNIYDISYRIISDHIRTIIYSINDGVIPTSNKRGYVLKKIIRRTIIHSNKLSINNLLSNLISILLNQFQDIDEIKKKEIYLIVFDEENKFIKLLEKSKKEFLKIKNFDTNTLFNMYSTKGIPIEIIKNYCEIIIYTSMTLNLMKNYNVIKKYRSR